MSQGDTVDMHSSKNNSQKNTLTSSLPSSTYTYLISMVLAALLIAIFFGMTMHPAINRQPADEYLSHTPGWETMPAGARSAYFGIHGGTVPVSLLTTSEGTSLVTFVGQTGNDFLELLRKVDVKLPSLFNATRKEVQQPEQLDKSLADKVKQHTLTAGSASSSLPVVSLSGESLSSLAFKGDILQPFGLSDTPLSIEGQVSMPEPWKQLPRYRILVDPNYLQPREQNDG